MTCLRALGYFTSPATQIVFLMLAPYFNRFFTLCLGAEATTRTKKAKNRSSNIVKPVHIPRILCVFYLFLGPPNTLLNFAVFA